VRTRAKKRGGAACGSGDIWQDARGLAARALGKGRRVRPRDWRPGKQSPAGLAPAGKSSRGAAAERKPSRKPSVLEGKAAMSRQGRGGPCQSALKGAEERELEMVV